MIFHILLVQYEKLGIPENVPTVSRYRAFVLASAAVARF
jgi:hypothetical protein